MTAYVMAGGLLFNFRNGLYLQYGWPWNILQAFYVVMIREFLIGQI